MQILHPVSEKRGNQAHPEHRGVSSLQPFEEGYLSILARQLTSEAVREDCENTIATR